jgi:CheY-like chemotaxis protein
VTHDEETARLAHDIMSPLAAIVGYAELLLLRDDPEVRAEAPAAILEAATSLKSAVYDLIDSAGVKQVRRDPGQSVKPRIAERAVDAPRRCVLIVDDEPLVRMLLRTTLPSESFDVLEASDGETALRLVAGGNPSLVVLDWHLPGRSGAEVLRDVKRIHPALPVLILTAAHDPEDRLRAAELGADVFLTKPFSPLELLEAIERLLSEGALDQRS